MNFVTFFLIPLTFFAGYSVTAKASSLCSKNETVVFNCPTIRKNISICAVMQKNNISELTYRSGKSANTIELQLPEVPQNWAGNVKVERNWARNTITHQNLEVSSVTFTNKDYRYEVYVRERENGQLDYASVTVRNSDLSQWQELSCKRKETTDNLSIMEGTN